MANVRATTPMSKAAQLRPAPVVATVRFWFRPVAAAAWDATTAHNGIPCDGIMVDSEGAQLTGIPGGAAAGAVQMAPMSANVLYPVSFYTLSAGYTGQVTLCWFEDPTAV